MALSLSNYSFMVIVVCVYAAAHPRSALNYERYPYYSREDWGAAPATDVSPISTPVPYVVIHHTYIPGACNTTAECMESMRSMQIYHQSLDWGDIGYNFGIGSEGGAYEGRGWHIMGIHAGRANKYSIGIVLIGDWRVNLPPPKQLITTKALIAKGVKEGVISPQYRLIGHSQVMATECPGGALLNHIATWDHYWPGHVDFPTPSTTPSHSIGSYFAIGSDGAVYAGRGWSVVGAHAVGVNSRSIGIVFIGDYVSDLPPPRSLQAAKDLIAVGVRFGFISPSYNIIGHRQVIATECPGQSLYTEISSWDRFLPHFDVNALNQ